MWDCRLAVVLGAAVGVAAIGLTACDPCGLIPCDGSGYGVWITNESDGRVLVGFAPTPEGGRSWEVPPGTVDGRGPWVSLEEGAADDPGQISLYHEDCAAIDTFSVEPGEYRLYIGADGQATLTAENVPNDAGDPLLPATVTC